jgi:hypothetical protein
MEQEYCQLVKNPDKSRFRFTKVPNFELLPTPKPRVKVVYFDKNMSEKLKKIYRSTKNYLTNNKAYLTRRLWQNAV